jgi:hypothetical protein
MLKVRKHVGDMFFLGFQSTQSLGEFTGEEGDLFDDVYKGDDPKARIRPSLARWRIRERWRTSLC